jgi:hypothetical protein
MFLSMAGLQQELEILSVTEESLLKDHPMFLLGRVEDFYIDYRVDMRFCKRS